MDAKTSWKGYFKGLFRGYKEKAKPVKSDQEDKKYVKELESHQL